jgi:hypothetical protein
MQEVVLVPAQCSACGEAFEVAYDGLYDNELLVLRALKAQQMQLPLTCDECW